MDIGIRELRDGLSRHLAYVREGHTITVTDHGKPIAKIVPVEGQTNLQKLIAEGVVRPPLRPKRPARIPSKADGIVSDLIPEQRR
ncbi:type II toxin-antitoxin system prevent-host-death family antitoxin [Kribbella sandramycini]|uniref:Antitoxin n=1 Tax=Kribbella sandramycini TaxID=60450 RepID=A0A7Y4L073_9ACTN|nr:type II toxin-antitoxin system prevent-host-death family antitoxin [Kribbella sandramycini]MBB6565626.1 prevent-host-death family protein [Kribbella sandramycini]NOL41889.1 type II toxin-antitoxin system prevent-host-death family antitoxin [Kribbella sandramycini]